MRTTIELPVELLREAKEYAARNGVPVRQVFERALRAVLSESHATKRRFRLKTVTTKGKGLACNTDWATIRSLAYEGHGG